MGHSVKKIAITGASGFLGTNMLKQLAGDETTQVYAFCFAGEEDKPNFTKAANIIPVHNDDIDKFDFSQIDIVIQCAFPRNADSAVIANGLDFVAKVLRLAVSQGAGAFINISSQSIYDPERKEPAAESDPAVLTTKYAVGKYAVELMVNTVCADIPHTNIRMASLIGEAFDQRVTNKMVDLALETGSLTVTDDQQFFGYMNVEDAAKGILSLTKIAPETWREAYNLGSETTYTLKTMAETIADVFAAELNRTVTIAVNAGEKCLNSALNGSAMLHDTGFAPQIQLSESIRRILRYKLEQRKQSQ